MEIDWVDINITEPTIDGLYLIRTNYGREYFLKYYG